MVRFFLKWNPNRFSFFLTALRTTALTLLVDVGKGIHHLVAKTIALSTLFWGHKLIWKMTINTDVSCACVVQQLFLLFNEKNRFCYSKRFQSLTGQESVNTGTNQVDLSATATDLDSLKQEILAEVRQEISRAKQEIIEGLFLCISLISTTVLVCLSHIIFESVYAIKIKL